MKKDMEKSAYKYKEDRVTKWFLKRGLDFTGAVKVRNALTVISVVIFVLYITFGNVWMDMLREGSEKPGTESAENMTLEERVQSVQAQRDGEAEPAELSPVKKALILMIRIGLFVLLAAVLYMMHISNILWVFCLIYGPIFLVLSFQAFEKGSLGSVILLILGIVSTAAGILLFRPHRERMKAESSRTGQRSL